MYHTAKKGKKTITTPHRLQRSQLATTHNTSIQSYLPTAAADLLLCVIFYSLFCFSIFLCASDLYTYDCEWCTTYVSLLSLLFRHSSISSFESAYKCNKFYLRSRRAREERRNMIIFDLFLFCATSPPSSFAVVHLSFCNRNSTHILKHITDAMKWHQSIGSSQFASASKQSKLIV